MRSSILKYVSLHLFARNLGTVPSRKSIPALESDLKMMLEEIHAQLDAGAKHAPELREMAKYYFDGKGKAIRPVIAVTLGHAINNHLNVGNVDNLVQRQRRVAVISEMIHTASLVHDDVLDHAEQRRGKPSINVKWDIRKSTICGDYILSVASNMMSKIGNDDVVITLSQILTDLVNGEFQQLQNKNSESERFQLYLNKTFNKTASLIAYSCRGNAILAGANPELAECCYEYGRNIGVAFQLVDDLLDFVSSSELLGKPAAADLKLGLATAPVLFASSKFRELEPMIDRRFSEPGDIEAAFDAVLKSDGLERTRELATNHCGDAVKSIRDLKDSSFKLSLIDICDRVLNRIK
ncbi:all trans-polyprenyl-diphosphate synthase PDSS1 [Lepeophtheirus salmonis]|uniref:Decaprenyldiphosphate synthase subunit 1like [Nasonia vitripennis] n=1 Tax=Lepeophtheirus salmonis TaxID=72036 RepID=A0A0K2TM75_LEPSM|nr:all trans-polyprenyl-diphosphate synthase PDSS1-like [Lepeophtheirus salmonis]XP_040571657.1 all trans-polyprenyl-diphosphate synthase PDSS1-like [Lepeophtheirus salmonis]XP_040571658.1 all trans-polyprenyl-diphosphate synthase PDSS1-like [Lepeophtheirus salmonis]